MQGIELTFYAIMSTSDSESILVTTTDSSSDHSVSESESDWGESHDTSDEIYLFDSEHMDAPRRHLQYCLGTFWCERFTMATETGTEAGLFLDVSVSERAFFEFPYRLIMKYTSDYNVYLFVSPLLEPQRLEILQIVIETSPDGFEFYKVIVKTFWLRLVQRRWKRIYRERQHVFKVRISWKNLRYSQLRGRHLPGYNIVTGVLFMMTLPYLISGSTGT